MSFLTNKLADARASAKGQTMTEYVLIIAAIAVAGYTPTSASKAELTPSSPA